jgi:hypothetical protein
VKTFLTKLSDSAAHPSCTQIFQNMKGDVTGLVAFVSNLEILYLNRMSEEHVIYTSKYVGI